MLEGAAGGGRARGTMDVTCLEGDAQALPLPDASFDVALSTFGCMFAPDQARTAAELVRVVRPGGRIGFTGWTPDGDAGRFLQVVGRSARRRPRGGQPDGLGRRGARARTVRADGAPGRA